MTALRDHGRIEELLAAAALGGLDPADERELAEERAAHGDCETCRALERGYADVAGRLAFALDPAPVPAGMEDALASRIASLSLDRAARLEAAPRGGGRVRGALRAVLAAAAAAALFAAGWVVRGAGADAPLEGVRILAFDGQGDLAAVYRPGERGVVLVGSDLTELPPDRVLELWTIRGETPARVACLRPADGRLLAYLDAEVADADLLALTVEPPSCPHRPTSEPILTAEVHAS